MYKKSLILPVVVSGLVFTSGMAIAKPERPAHGHDFISKLDSNKDGAISSAEFNANLSDNYAKIDKNGNGVIDLSEFTQHGKEKRAEYKKKKAERRKEGRARYFKKLDGNGDGVISRAEYIAKAVKRAEEKAAEKFAKLDGSDADGEISQKEFLENRSRDDKKSRYSHSEKKRDKNHSVEKMFSRMDSNGDGNITEAENRAARTKWFNKLDLNQDGSVTEGELKQAWRDRKVKK